MLTVSSTTLQVNHLQQLSGNRVNELKKSLEINISKAFYFALTTI